MEAQQAACNVSQLQVATPGLPVPPACRMGPLRALAECAEPGKAQAAACTSRAGLEALPMVASALR